MDFLHAMPLKRRIFGILICLSLGLLSAWGAEGKGGKAALQLPPEEQSTEDVPGVPGDEEWLPPHLGANERPLSSGKQARKESQPRPDSQESPAKLKKVGSHQPTGAAHESSPKQEIPQSPLENLEKLEKLEKLDNSPPVSAIESNASSPFAEESPGQTDAPHSDTREDESPATTQLIESDGKNVGDEHRGSGFVWFGVIFTVLLIGVFVFT